MKNFLAFYYQQRDLVISMALRDFRNRYQGSLLGMAWALIQPLAMMTILYFVFSYGLKVGGKSGSSFIAWFFSATIAWNFFQDAWSSATGAYYEYSYLVKKVQFRLAIIPFIKVLSSLFLHLVFIGIVTAVIYFTDKPPSLYLLQLVYFAAALVFLIFGVSWITSTLNVFLKDTAQIVAILTQMGFWATPIIWNIEAIPERYQFWIKLNPMYYIIDGYRMSMLYQQPFWQAGLMPTVVFWIFSTACFCLGLFLFKKLKPHFADVL